MADPCQPIRIEIANLEQDLASLRPTTGEAVVLDGPGLPRGPIGSDGPGTQDDVRELIEAIQTQIAQKKQELAECEKNFVQPGAFLCNDGGLYYVREIGTDVFWFGERRDGGFANVMFGHRDGSVIRGRWFDVPKGSTQSSGDIELLVNAADNSMTLIAATGGFGGTRWEPHKPFVNRGLDATMAFTRARFEEPGLTGTWMGRDGGTYYIREIDNQVVWFGESLSFGSNAFSNVFLGSRDGDTIRGTWADVPKGNMTGSGTLTLDLNGTLLGERSTLTRTDQTGGFGGSHWSRVAALRVDVRLDTLFVLDTEDVFGDEPFLWTVFVKLDGDTVDVTTLDPNGSEPLATVRSNHAKNHGNITSETGIGAGTSLVIPPDVGRFSTVLKTPRGIDPGIEEVRKATLFAFAVAAFEQDSSPEGAIQAGRVALLQALQDGIDSLVRKLIRDLMPPDKDKLRELFREIGEQAGQAALDAAKNATDTVSLGAVDPDDFIGRKVEFYNFIELSDLVRQTTPHTFTLDFKGDGAHYRVTGSMRVT